MRSWNFAVGMMGPKWWAIYRKEGLMGAVLRGKIYRPTHEKAGFSDEVARLVGTDTMGNRYYEDFTALGKNQRRWVEYADVGKVQPTFVKKIEPGWHGWMHYMYDDPPKADNYVKPYYMRHKMKVFRTDHCDPGANTNMNIGHLMNPDRKKNLEEGRQRMYTEWEPPKGNEQRNGKKILAE